MHIALQTLLKGDIIYPVNHKKNYWWRIKEMGTQQIALTTEELNLLLMIFAITEFDKEQPGNIPEGGVGEVLVSSSIIEPEDFDELSDNLLEYGFINEDCLITALGIKYLDNFAEDLKQIEKNPKAECINDYVKVDFKNLYKNIKETVSKVNWGKVYDRAYKGVSFLAALATIAMAFS